MDLSLGSRWNIRGGVLSLFAAAIIVMGFFIWRNTHQQTVKPLNYAQTKNALEEIYGNELLPFQLHDGKNPSNSDADPNSQADAYGKLTPAGADLLLDEFDLNSEDVLYDLGSGQGQLVLHAALATPVRKAVGIEKSQKNHEKGLRMLQRASTRHAIDPKRIELRLGDVLRSDLSDATVIYLSCTRLSSKALHDVLHKILTLPHGVKLASLKRLPKHNHLRYRKTIVIPTTKRPAVPVHIYHTLPPTAVPPPNDAEPAASIPSATVYPLEMAHALNTLYARDLAENSSTKQTGKPHDDNISHAELALAGIHVLFKELALTKQDVVVDLGSRIGKFPLQAYLATPARKVVGIEHLKKRHKLALAAKQKLFSGVTKYVPQPQRELVLLHADFLKSDLSDATVLYFCSSHSSRKILQALVDKVLQIPHSIRLVVFSELPKHQRLRKLNQLLVPTSWGNAVPLYIYQTVKPKNA